MNKIKMLPTWFRNQYKKHADNRKKRLEAKRIDSIYIEGIKRAFNEIQEDDLAYIAATYYRDNRKSGQEPKKAFEAAISRTLAEAEVYTDDETANNKLRDRMIVAGSRVIDARLAEDNDTSSPDSNQSQERPWIGLVWLIVIVLIIAAIFGIGKWLQESNETATVTAPTEQCPGSWQMSTSTPNKDHNLIVNGSEAIRNAKTDADARAALNSILEEVKQYKSVLVAYAHEFPTTKSHIDATKISDAPSCANEYTRQIVNEMYIDASKAKVTTGLAPTNGRNTELINGTVVKSKALGISGDRRAIKIVFENGDELWILGRCDNLVIIEKVPVAPKPPKKKPEQPEYPIKYPHKKRPPEVKPKNPSQDVGVNPNVAPFKKDDTGGDASKGHQVNYSDGATVSNGLQVNPTADAAKAQSDAVTESQQNVQQHIQAENQAVSSGGGVVDSDQSHTVSSPPPANW